MTNKGKEWMRINWIGYPAGKVIDRLISLFIPVLIPSKTSTTIPNRCCLGLVAMFYF
jgi:hypothetical protein